jgi:hypothetical protein
MPTKAPKKAARREPRVVGARAKSRRTPARPKAAKTSAKTAAAKTASAKAAGAKAAAESTNHPRATWGLLVYLAGDIAYGADAIREDLREILKAGGSADLRIVVQHDGPAGASRYIVPSRSSPNLAPIELGRVDSGSTSSLLEFLRWGMSVCDCERLALVLGSPLVVSPVDAEGDPQPDRASVFSLSYDQGSGNYMDVSSVAGVIREALSDARREQIDLLAIDSCRVQFLELAYELEDIVRILIAPQTEIPVRGWDFERVLGRWKKLAARTPPLGTPDLARALLDEIIECYRDGMEDLAVSALDLQRLDDVARAFDTMCIGSLQALGEGLIWKTRDLLRERFEDPASKPLYDCGSFFAVWGASLDAMADEAYQAWLGTTLQRTTGANIDRFCEAVSRHLESTRQTGSVDEPRIALMIEALRAPSRETPRTPDWNGKRSTTRYGAASRLLDEVSAGVKRRLDLLQPGARQEDDARERQAAADRDMALQAAIVHAFHLLPHERQYDLKRLEDSADTARRLARQSREAAIALLGSVEKEVTGMVVASRSVPDVTEGWPRWSGVSMYRPSKLDDLMNSSYQRFAFHRRVHWAALLGAANLIDQHPRALWRLVSSLLATGSAGTRRDVLRRLTGSDSVIWGLREQFKVMAPAPTLTLSLERRSTRIPAASSTSPNGEVTRENYLLRLESIVRGAVVTEQESRVQPSVMERALHELNELLQASATSTRGLSDLRSIGGLLGEDIFQSLGRTLDDERELVRAESPDVTPHLQLQLPRELMKYPWELLHHHGEWLGERYAMGRQVFMETGLARRVPGRRQGRVRPLIVGDPIFDSNLQWRQLPGARDEAEQVAGLFDRLCRDVGSIIDFDRKRDTRIHTRVTTADMRALLRDGGYDIVHFAGHGVFRADDPETSAWLMSDGELWSLEIRNTLAEHPAPPWLVYANACEAGMDAARPERKYQGNVFGLATAFINQGVAAYIAPLWPIDDMLAQHIALEFYRQLLCERATLGEALRRAKAGARRLMYPEQGARPMDVDVLYEGLGWASLVLYGDPTEELFQALAGGAGDKPRIGEALLALSGPELDRRAALADRRAVMTKPSPGLRPPNGVRVPARTGQQASPLHAADHVVADWVRGPNWAPLIAEQRGAAPTNGANAANGGANAAPVANAANGDVTLELIEDAGMRRWRVRRPGAPAAGTRGAGAAEDSLPGSQIAMLLSDDRVRRMLPGRRGMIRVIGRWIVGGLKDGIAGLVQEYDREQVKTEGLLIVNGTTSQQLVPASRNVAGAVKSTAPANRALVLIHGTFSKTASPVDGFGPTFMQWARERYRVVLGLDHWTLSKTPQDNARLLADELRAFDPELMKNGRLDIISHSRGGLVGRAFCELENHADAVRNLIFLGTPNCGTDLANPKNWGSLADLLVNMTGVDGAELFGRLSGLLAQLAVHRVVSDVPGLLAQSPDSAMTAGSFLNKLQNSKSDRTRIRYGVVCSEFEPSTLVPNLAKLVKSAKDASVDIAMDTLFGTANDLVVNTRHAWGIGRSPADVTTLPTFVRPDRVLLYGPPTMESPPKGVVCERALGVHHCNLFSQTRAQDSIKTWLTEA